MGDRPIDRVDKKAEKLRKAMSERDRRHLVGHRDFNRLERLRQIPESEWLGRDRAWFVWYTWFRTILCFFLLLVFGPPHLLLSIIMWPFRLMHDGRKYLWRQVEYFLMVDAASRLRDEEQAE